MNIVSRLTEGVVGGQRFFQIPIQRRNRSVDVEKLIESARSSKEETSKDDVELEQRHADWTAEKQLTKTDSENCQMDIGKRLCDVDASHSIVKFAGSAVSKDSFDVSDLCRPDAWATYYKKLRDIGRTLEHKEGWEHFDRVFMISALTGDGVDDLRVSNQTTYIVVNRFILNSCII